MKNIPNHLFIDVVAISQGWLRPSFCEKPLDYWNIRIFQFGIVMLLAMFRLWDDRSTLGPHIIRVVFVGSKKEMARVYAWRIVAAMKDAHSIRDDSEMNLPRESVNSYHPHSPVNPVSENAVVESDFSSSPNPASVGFVDLGPKAFDQWKAFLPESCRWHRSQIIGIHGDMISSGGKQCH